jgi:hypothetical protein
MRFVPGVTCFFAQPYRRIEYWLRSPKLAGFRETCVQARGAENQEVYLTFSLNQFPPFKFEITRWHSENMWIEELRGHLAELTHGFWQLFGSRNVPIRALGRSPSSGKAFQQAEDRDALDRELKASSSSLF